MKRMTTEKFYETCEEYYTLVHDCGMKAEEALEEVKQWLKSTKIYGFSEMLTKFGIGTHEELYRYGGQLAGEIAAF
jgi:DNA-binding protein H-NS